MLSSPRPWGCFLALLLVNQLTFVFPTPVGVFLDSETNPTFFDCLPHARGGVSSLFVGVYLPLVSSPRQWGCFCKKFRFFCNFVVFPTPVGVFLSIAYGEVDHTRLPHARGGVSQG